MRWVSRSRPRRVPRPRVRTRSRVCCSDASVLSGGSPGDGRRTAPADARTAWRQPISRYETASPWRQRRRTAGTARSSWPRPPWTHLHPRGRHLLPPGVGDRALRCPHPQHGHAPGPTARPRPTGAGPALETGIPQRSPPTASAAPPRSLRTSAATSATTALTAPRPCSPTGPRRTRARCERRTRASPLRGDRAPPRKKPPHNVSVVQGLRASLSQRARPAGLEPATF